jgi:hypothetical protein
MQVVVTKEIKSNYTGQVLRKLKVINPELCVDTIKIARESVIGAKEKNDCVVRAFMAALDTSYDSTHAFVKKYLKRENKKGTYTSIHLPNVIGKVKNGKKIKLYGVSPSHDYLIGYMFKDAKVITNPKYKKPTGYTLRSFIENHPTGRYFLIVEGHAVAVVDGKLYGNTGEGNYKINRRVHYAVECK